MTKWSLWHTFLLSWKAISSKLVFRLKWGTNGTIEWYKVWLVACGFTQMPRIDFDQVLLPVVKLTSIHILCSLAVCLQLHSHHLDVNAAFLNGKLQGTDWRQAGRRLLRWVTCCPTSVSDGWLLKNQLQMPDNSGFTNLTSLAKKIAKKTLITGLVLSREMASVKTYSNHGS